MPTQIWKENHIVHPQWPNLYRMKTAMSYPPDAHEYPQNYEINPYYKRWSQRGDWVYPWYYFRVHYEFAILKTPPTQFFTLLASQQEGNLRLYLTYQDTENPDWYDATVEVLVPAGQDYSNWRGSEGIVSNDHTDVPTWYPLPWAWADNNLGDGPFYIDKYVHIKYTPRDWPSGINLLTKACPSLGVNSLYKTLR